LLIAEESGCDAFHENETPTALVGAPLRADVRLRAGARVDVDGDEAGRIGVIAGKKLMSMVWSVFIQLPYAWKIVPCMINPA
jgi:hypothetical protein